MVIGAGSLVVEVATTLAGKRSNESVSECIVTVSYLLIFVVFGYESESITGCAVAPALC